MQCELQREYSTLGIMDQVRAYTGILGKVLQKTEPIEGV